MALAVPITALVFASWDVPLVGQGQPLDRQETLMSRCDNVLGDTLVKLVPGCND